MLSSELIAPAPVPLFIKLTKCIAPMALVDLVEDNPFPEAIILKYSPSVLSEKVNTVDDKITKIKINEVVNQADSLKKGKVVSDKQVVSLMRYYQLIQEIDNVAKG